MKLHNPQLTASFQRLCGVRPAKQKNKYTITNPFLYYVGHFGASLGDETFYIVFFLMLLWNIDSFLARRICMFWGIFMYLGQATKDILRWPRPASPPVYRLEEKYALEYGMPSTHAMVGAGMPFGLLFLCMSRYPDCWLIGLLIATCWCALVCFSRLYLGMHSVLDIMVGLTYVGLLLPVYLAVVEPLDRILLSSSWAPLLIISVPLLALINYPRLERWSTARGDTTMIVGTGVGVMLAYWLCNRYGLISTPLIPPPYDIAIPTLAGITTSFLRFVLGTVILLLARFIVKTCTMQLACWIQGLDKHVEEVRQRLSVELPTKFITCITNSLFCVILAPQLFKYFGIERESFFHEL